MKTLLLVSLILSMMVYISLKFFLAPSPSWGMALKSRSQTFHTNVIFAYIIKTDFTGNGDSYRAKVLFSSIPAPKPDL